MSKYIKAPIILLLIAFNLIPFIWLVIVSFLPNESCDRGISFPSLDMLTFDNYKGLSSYSNFFEYFFNTLSVSFISAFFVTCTSTLGAYGLTRFYKQYVSKSEIIVIIGYLLSPIMLVFPYALILTKIGLIGTLFGLILANIALCLPFSLFLMIRYMQAVREEFDQTAMLDGANWSQIFFLIIVPRVKPGIFAVAVFSFILAWNDVLFALELANPNTKTLAAGVKEKILDVEQTTYGSFAAASIIIALLAILIFGFLQAWVDKQLQNESIEF